MSYIYQKINELLEKQETFALATIVDYKGSVPRRLAKMIVTRDLKTYGTIGGGCVEGQVAEEAALMLREGGKGVVLKSYDLVEEEAGGVGMNCGGKIDVTIEIVQPEPRLIIAGSGHIASSLAKLAQMLEFEIVVVDPMAKKDRYPQARLVIADFVETAMPTIHVSPNTYIVIVTRHKDDMPALKAALKTDATYIGLIGSKRRVLQAFQILLKEGVTTQQLDRINAPVGLNIGAETPDEIALSIMAEITQHRRFGGTKPAEPKKVSTASIRTLSDEQQPPQQPAK
ncbi:MAG TPA: XdhC/CoxI family protein [Terriglobales bacterium]|nr:XdhC/CoxI family protein [Terriglobales bacterium]